MSFVVILEYSHIQVKSLKLMEYLQSISENIKKLKRTYFTIVVNCENNILRHKNDVNDKIKNCEILNQSSYIVIK